MALLIRSRLLEIFTDPHVLPQENLPMLLEPIQNLFNILLEEPQSQSLMEFDLLGMPLVLQLPVVRQDLVDDGQHVTRALLIVCRGVHGLGRGAGLLKIFQS